MTIQDREFAKNRIEYLLKISNFALDKHDKEALELAIQALSQEPTVTSTDETMTMVYPTIVCDDAISRKAVLSVIGNVKPHNYEQEDIKQRILNVVSRTPSVTQKSGRWKVHKNYYECSNCESQISNEFFVNYRFCPHCGAKMVEPQESEDKE